MPWGNSFRLWPVAFSFIIWGHRTGCISKHVYQNTKVHKWFIPVINNFTNWNLFFMKIKLVTYVSFLLAEQGGWLWIPARFYLRRKRSSLRTITTATVITVYNFVFLWQFMVYRRLSLTSFSPRELIALSLPPTISCIFCFASAETLIADLFCCLFYQTVSR